MKAFLTKEDREFIARALPHIARTESDERTARQFDWETCDMAALLPDTAVEDGCYYFGKTAAEWAASDWENLDGCRREELAADGITDAAGYAERLQATGRLVQGEFGVFEVV